VTCAPRPEVRVLKDAESLGRAAAELFALRAGQAVLDRDRFAVALSGGSTPRPFYALLGSAYRDSIDWKRVHIFWVDERCVNKDREESNFKLVFDALLSRAPVPERNIHRIRGEEDPEQAALFYERELRAFFGPAPVPVFDLIALGAGGDGHTASLFPGSAAVRERTRLAVPVYREAPRLNRVTLTLPVLNQAAHVVFLASGRSKAGVVHEIIETDNPRLYPAGMVRPQKGAVTWLLDREAAAELRSPVVSA
jgi:6-phosphogluconolactonase